MYGASFNRGVAHVPRALTTQYARLSTERAQLKSRLTELESELSAVTYALKVVDPAWAPPKAAKRAYRRVASLAGGKLSVNQSIPTE